MTGRKRIVIVGGGVAGLFLASNLPKKRGKGFDFDITLIDRETAYFWKPLIHSVAVGTADASFHETNFAAQGESRGFSYVYGDAIRIDRQRKTVVLAPIFEADEEIVPERSVEYDCLVLSVGCRGNDFGVPGVSAHAEMIDTRTQAIAFNDKLRGRLLRSATQRTPLRIGIVGGGATGVELAAELIRIAHAVEDFGMGDARDRLVVTLLEADKRLLRPFPDRVAEAATAKLKELGVVVRTQAAVEAIEDAAIVLKGPERVEADLIAWTAGLKAPDLLSSLQDLERTKAGQLIVDQNLRCPGDPTIFALGDCASPHLPALGKPVPTTAQAANQHARYLHRHLPKLLAGQTAPPASFHEFGSLVLLGGFDAYGNLGRLGMFKGGFVQGRIAELGHAMLHRQFQSSIHGPVKGSLLWIVDMLNRQVRPQSRLP